jgi:hypothetical protein
MKHIKKFEESFSKEVDMETEDRQTIQIFIRHTQRLASVT